MLYGDAAVVLASVPSKSVNCCVTSPPYFGLRDYGVSGEIGAESRVGDYVTNLCNVLSEVGRCLRDDGTLWLNLGDSYASGKKNRTPSQADANSTLAGRKQIHGGVLVQPDKTLDVPAKNLIGVPWRVAFALQDAGWILRQDIIWSKPNPMPESVRDRCVKSHEYMFMFVKSQKYYFNYDAMREPATYAGKPRGGSKNRYKSGNTGADSKVYDMRTKRSVWSVQPSRVKGGNTKHFACFPEKLIEPCIMASTPPGGMVLDPFAGSGTTGRVAKRLGMNSILVELNKEYRPLIEAD